MLRVLLFLIPLWLSRPVLAQDRLCIEFEARLKNLMERLHALDSDDARRQLNDSIQNEMAGFLAMPGCFDYPFDSLTRIGKVRSPDQAFRIFTWNVPLSAFRHNYHGILQVDAGRKSPCQVFVLRDRSCKLEELLHTETGCEDWPGMLYYQVLRHRTGGDVVYTLIGYHFHDRFSDKKVLDVLYFDQGGQPVFGRPLFQTEQGVQHRVIFEYSGEVVMAVRYNPDLKMIVYDHLSPIEPELEGHLRFYAPDFSYDGYKWKRGMWIHQSDIDVRNR